MLKGGFEGKCLREGLSHESPVLWPYITRPLACEALEAMRGRLSFHFKTWICLLK